MNSAKTLLGNASVYTGANVLNAGIPFLLLPVLTRVLSPTDYGTIAMFGIVVTIMGAFTGLSVHGAVGVRYFQLDQERMPSYVGACLVILIMSSAAVFCAVAIGRPPLEMITHVPGDWLMVAVLVSSAQVVINIRLSLWQVQHKAIRYGAFQISQSLLNAGLSLFLILRLGMAWEGRVLGQAAAVIAFMFIALFLLFRRAETSWPTNTSDARDALKFGVPLIPHVIGGLLIVTTDRFMITNMLDVGQAGIYMVALQLGMVLGLLTDSFNRAYAPYLMGALVTEDPARDRQIVRGTYFYFIVVTVLGLLLGLTAPKLLGILVGEKFRAAAGAVLYVAMGYAFGGMYYMVANYIFFMSKTGSLALVTFASGVFNIFATYFLVKLNGVIGAAQAFMLSQAMIFFSTWWLAQRVRPMPWRTALFRVTP
jgi:O-antigen/teichoic acid export membrane protein